jgi:hypothetical protein
MRAILATGEIARSYVGDQPGRLDPCAQLGELALQAGGCELIDALASFEILELVLPEMEERGFGRQILT